MNNENTHKAIDGEKAPVPAKCFEGKINNEIQIYCCYNAETDKDKFSNKSLKKTMEENGDG